MCVCVCARARASMYIHVYIQQTVCACAPGSSGLNTTSSQNTSTTTFSTIFHYYKPLLVLGRVLYSINTHHYHLYYIPLIQTTTTFSLHVIETSHYYCYTYH